MTLQSLFHRISRSFTRSCQKVAVAAAALPGVAVAQQGLPELEEPTQGGGGGIRSTAQGYMYDGFILGGLLLCTVAFIWVGIACLSAFNEARVRGEWAKFGVTAFVGVILILVVIWLSTEAAPILAQ